MLGIALVNFADDGEFGAAIGFADVVVAAFLLNLDLVELRQAANERVAAATGRGNRDVQ